MKKLTLLTALIGLSIASCNKEPKETWATDNSNFKLDLLFEKDGCKMYRFEDGGRCVYWATCSGNVGYTNIEGKTTVNQETQTSEIK